MRRIAAVVALVLVAAAVAVAAAAKAGDVATSGMTSITMKKSQKKEVVTMSTITEILIRISGFLLHAWF